MAKRFAHRTALTISVELYHAGTRLGLYRTRDVDASAAFIEAPGIGINRHDVVEVEFMIGTASVCKCRRKGVVVRTARDGIAVAFVNADTVFFETLEELLGAGTAAREFQSATDNTFNHQLPVLESYSRSA